MDFEKTNSSFFKRLMSFRPCFLLPTCVQSNGEMNESFTEAGARLDGREDEHETD